MSTAAERLDSARLTARRVSAVARSGLLGPVRPDVLVRIAREADARGAIAGTAVGAAIRWGDRPLLTDVAGTLTAREIDDRSNAIARWLIDGGARPGDGAAILCRNHRGFVDAMFGAMKAGMRVVFLNTGFAGPQIAEVCEREGVQTLLFDREFQDRAPGIAGSHVCMWPLGEARGTADITSDEIFARTSTAPVPVPAEKPSLVVLTSGTTGTPKGAARQELPALVSLGMAFDRVPFKTKGCTYVGPPFFHGLGLGGLLLSMNLGCRVVTHTHFDAEAALDAISREKATSAWVVPAMLQRILALGPERLRAARTPELKIIFCGGSQLPGQVAEQVLDAWGDVLYVLYGSTEVAYAAISTPADHRVAPTTVGRPCLGVKVSILDDDGRPVPAGTPGGIYVSTGVEFGGYTDGTNKAIVDGLMSSGDVGYLDAEGRLFISGRDDDMIISGGENVFPQEVEEVLARHPAVADVAVIGVDDPDFGSRLAAFVVLVESSQADTDALKLHVRQNLAAFKVPRDVTFLDALPRNATGKVVKRELRTSADSRSPSSS